VADCAILRRVKLACEDMELPARDHAMFVGATEDARDQAVPPRRRPPQDEPIDPGAQAGHQKLPMIVGIEDEDSSRRGTRDNVTSSRTAGAG
jgi:hypothetical protein